MTDETGQRLREALAAAVDLLTLSPSGHVGPDRVPWFIHCGISHGEDRPDCIVCQWLVRVRAALAAEAPTPSPDSLDMARLGEAMDLVDEEDGALGVLGRGRKADRVAAKYAALGPSGDSLTYIGEVDDSGGGWVSVIVDRDLVSYPEVGDKVYAALTPPEAEGADGGDGS